MPSDPAPSSDPATSPDPAPSSVAALRAVLRERTGPDADVDPAPLHDSSPVHAARLGDGTRVVVKPALDGGPGQRALTAWARALRAAGVGAVAPVDGLPVPIAVPGPEGVEHRVAYPFVDGRPVRLPDDLALLGDLLGRLHAASAPLADDPALTDLPRFAWPEHDAASVAEDVDAIAAVVARLGLPDEVAARWADELEGFWDAQLPRVRDAALPAWPVALDVRAVNVVVGDDGPVMVDLENGEVAPRLLDLAYTALFAGHEAGPAALPAAREWAVLRDAYLAVAPPLTPAERARWEDALVYMRLEWGTWMLTAGTDDAEWADPARRGYLTDLLLLEPGRWPL
ncbi:MAG: hypothetical protein J7503_05000 [Cellulomonas iranensis]|uniref:hypothetical protein n=1 Tax=Cellulomonas iranensis TaxID=76862 RepID=UPI001B1BFC23|nr:hypothetical protein [Cellulomonas iranensis]MBO9568164.1 hypothetical protein [Cellulomonas iranensis]